MIKKSQFSNISSCCRSIIVKFSKYTYLYSIVHIVSHIVYYIKYFYCMHYTNVIILAEKN